MGGADQLIGDPAEELWNLESATDRHRQILSLAISTTEDQAINASNFSRFYITPSQELVSAVALAGMEWDMPMLSEIVEIERDTGWSAMRALGSIARGAVRNTFMAMDSLIDQTWSRPLRIIEQLVQGDGDVGFWDAYDRSGQPELSQAIRAVATGEGGNIHTGSGWTPSPYDPAEDPEIVDEFMARWQRLQAAGQGLNGQEQIWDQVLVDMAPNMPYDVVQRARETADATRYTVQLPDGTFEETGVSMGRFLSNRLANVGGLEIVRPNTIPAQIISGSIDAYTRVTTDPLNIPADALTDAMRFGKLIVPDAGKGLGANAEQLKALEMANDWRWWVSPRTVDKWAETKAGTYTLDQLAKSGSISEINQVLKPLPTHIQMAVKNAKTPKAVLNIIRPHLGKELAKAPTMSRYGHNMIGSRVLGARSYIKPEKGAAGGVTVYADETRLGKLFRREAAEQTGGAVVLDTADPHSTVDNVLQLLDTIGATQKEVDDTLEIIMLRGHTHGGQSQAVARINTITKRRLVEIGYDADDVDVMMAPIIERQAIMHQYNTDVMGNPMARMDEGYWLVPDGQGGHTPVYKPNAAHEAQFSHRTMVLPSIREYRQVTSKARTFLEQNRIKRSMGEYVPIGFNQVEHEKNLATWLRYRMDQGMGAWRNMALLRIGWPLRVLPDEAARIMASGYGSMFTDPLHYLAAVIRGDMTGTTGDSIVDWVGMHGGYGTGGFSRGAQPSVTGGKIPNAPRDIDEAVRLTNRQWIIEPLYLGDGSLNPAGVEGLVDNLITLYAAESTTLIIDYGVDGALDILYPAGGRASEQLRRIAKDAADDNLWASAVNSRAAARKALEKTEAQIARFSGGDFYYKQLAPDGSSTGKWLNRKGQPVETYEMVEDGQGGMRALTGPDLDGLLRAREIPGRSKARTVEAKRRMLMEADGNPWALTEMGPDASTYTVDLGSPRVHGFIARGEDPGDLIPAAEFEEFTRRSVAGRDDETGEVLGLRVEGYVFHGSETGGIDELSMGGLTHDVQRAMGIGESRSLVLEGEPVVYVFKTEDLPEEIQRAMRNNIDVENYRGPQSDWIDASDVPEDTMIDIGGSPRRIDEATGLGFQGWLDGAPFFATRPPVIASATPRPHTVMTLDEARAAIQRGTLFPAEGSVAPRKLIEESMSQRKLINLRKQIPELYDDVHSLPDTAPRAIKGADPTSFGQETVNQLFWALGGKPTQQFLRQPFFATRWTDEMARLYLWATPETRKGIRALAEQNNLGAQLDVYIQRQLKNRGMKSVPEKGRLRLTVDEADEMSRYVALDHVRELLYDLTKSNNFWDSMRLITPFGEAWWEVVSRWANLFNPWGEIGGVRQGGQAIRNIRRPWQVGNASQEQGWFDEDEFGNEVWNVPLPWGQYEKGGMRVAAQLDLKSLAFVDPSNARSTWSPSVGPMGQFPGAIVDPLLPEPLRRITRGVLYGKFQPPDTSSLGRVVSSLVPTAYRRAIEQLSDGEFRGDLAAATHQIYNGLCGSGDPTYDCNTYTGSTAATKEAKRVGGQIGWLRVLNAAVMPGQPQYRSQINLLHNEADQDRWDEILKSDDQEFWVNSGVLQEEYRTATDLFGNENDAWSYIFNRYGVDALDFMPSTRQVIPTAMTEEAYNHVRNNPAITEWARFTQMAFAPISPGADFYSTAHREALETGRRERLSVDQMAELQSVNKGAMAMHRLEQVYEQAVAAIEANGEFAGLPATKRSQLQQLADWRERERDVIATQFVYWGPDANPVFVSQRPTFRQFIDEIRTYADPSSPNFNQEAKDALSEVSPGMVEFLSEVMLYWNRAEEISHDRGNTAKWWRTGSISRDLEPGFEVDVAENIRNWFLAGVNQASNRIVDERDRNGAIWVAERIFTPLLEGYDFADPIVLDLGKPPIVDLREVDEEPSNLVDQTEQREPALAP